MKAVAVVMAQLAALVAINHAGYLVAGALQLPVPGNLLGMVFLLALLATGAVRLPWIETSASFLLRHLAFFFVPITVGLMGFADLLVANGTALLAILAVSAAIGIWLAGLCSQLVARARGGAPREGDPA